MAKRKRKPSAAQRDKSSIQAAKYLKRVGILSDRTKLHGGQFISKRVLDRVREFGYVAEARYTSIPVSKRLAEQARDAGYQTVRGNRIIVPNERKRIEGLRRGDLAGVVPVRGGMMEVVHLPGSIMDMHALVQRMQSKRGLEDLKAPDEMFAFKFFGHMSYQPFPNTEMFLEYLTHYQTIFDDEGDPDSLKAEALHDAFENLVILRMRPGDYHPPPPEARRLSARARRRASKTQEDRRHSATSNYKPRDEMLPAKLKRIRLEDAERQREVRAAMTAKEKDAYKEAAKKRAKEHRIKMRQQQGK